VTDATTLARPSEPVELAPTESAGQGVALTGMSRSRSSLLCALKTSGEATAEGLAANLSLTVAAVRQQLAPLQDEGLVAHRDERSGRGRPRRWYCLTPAAETLFPKRYGQLANQLLGFIEEAGPGLVKEAFNRRAEQRRARAEARLGGLSFDAAVTELAAILDEDGYLARAEKVSPGFWRIAELNCAILDVARQHGSACTSELAFIRSVLPLASVVRVSHLLSGGRSCSYEIRLGAGATPLGRPTDEGDVSLAKSNDLGTSIS
jgi:DeoR family transcriptional regulator, suf operon transcriptional repressor